MRAHLLRPPLVRAIGIFAVALLVGACSGSSTKAPATVPAGLAGTSWQLGLQGGTQPAAQTPATLVFGTDGSVSGFAGCAPFTASFTSTSTTVAITAVTLTPTQNICAPQTLALQAAYLKALAEATQWQAGDMAGAIPSGTKGVVVLAPVKLALSGGPTSLVFTLN